MSERSQNLKDVRQCEQRTCVRTAAGVGRRTKPILTGPSHLSPGLRQAGTLGTNQSQPRPFARHVTARGQAWSPLDREPSLAHDCPWGGHASSARTLLKATCLRLDSSSGPWAMWELKNGCDCIHARTLPMPAQSSGCVYATVLEWVFGPGATSVLLDHVSPCWYQGRSPRGRI